MSKSKKKSDASPRWRAGTKLGRTLYYRSPIDGKECCVGMVDHADIARDIVNAMNRIGVCHRCHDDVEPGYNFCAGCADEAGP